jgi:hypothetical protein
MGIGLNQTNLNLCIVLQAHTNFKEAILKFNKHMFFTVGREDQRHSTNFALSSLNV